VTAEPHGMQVLLVDDDDGLRDTFAELLGEAGIDVEAARSGEEALARLEATGPPEVLVTDLDLGAAMGGLALSARISQQWPGVGIVYITGRPWLIQDHQFCAHERLVPKPCTSVGLINAIQALRGR